MPGSIEEQVTEEIQDEIVQFMDAGNLLNLFPSPPSISDITVETTRGWRPNKTKIYVEQFAQRVFSTGLEDDLEWINWKILEKMGVKQAGFDKIAKKPGKQMSHYFFTGMGLGSDGVRYPRPVKTNYNYLIETGTGNGSLGRPLLAGNAAGGFWGNITAMMLAIETGIGALVSKDFEKQNFLAFYPRTVESTMIH
ncbi:hypothetical protein LCGC14_3059470, partial [marine sediment metagenome]